MSILQIENTELPPRREMVVMRKRPLGETGIDVPWVGLGTAGLGYSGTGSFIDSLVNSVKNGIVPDDDAIHLIKNAIDCEANLIDVSPEFGNGRAERLVGHAIYERRSQVVLVDRTGKDFSDAGIRASLDKSLKMLGTDYIDVYLLNHPDSAVLDGKHEAFTTLQALKKEGKIRAFGASVCANLLKKAAENTPVQVLSARFNIFHQQAAEAFEVIKQKRIGFLAGSPLDSGFLGGRYGKMSTFFDFRKRWSRADISRRAVLRDKVEALRPALTSSAQLAIQFLLTFDAVSCVVAGARDQHQLIVNVDSPGTEIPADKVEALKQLWLTELKNKPLAR